MIAFHAGKMDSKLSIRVSSNFSRVLIHSGLWRLIYKDRYREQSMVAKTWLLCPTDIQNTSGNSIKKFRSMYLSTILLDSWILLHGTSNYLFTNGGPELVSKFLTMVCILLVAKKLATTAYNPQTNGQVESQNLTYPARLCHCDSHH